MGAALGARSSCLAAFWRWKPRQLTATDAPDSIGLFYDKRMAEHCNLEDSTHPEQPLRIVKIFERLEAEGLAARCKTLPCREATREELELKHTSSHVDAMLSISTKSENEAVRFGHQYNSVYFCPYSTKAGLLSAGSVLEASRQVCCGELKSAICVVRPPGHHAESGCAMGFCMFGNVAVAAAASRHRGWANRVLIVDWDVHHGNGTQRMFEDDPSVLYFSTHRHDGGKFYPGGAYGDYTSHGSGPGEGYSVNVPWDVKGARSRGYTPPGDAELIAAFEKVLMRIAKAFNPDLVLVSAGFDSAAGDPLGGCGVTPRGFYELTHQLMALAHGRLVIALEGGYNLESISSSMVACARALMHDAPPPSECDIGSPERYHIQTINKVCSHLCPFWPSLGDGGDTQDVPSRQSGLPDHLFEGTLLDMHFELRRYAEDCGRGYQDLVVEHEARLFQLDKPPPKVQRPPMQHRQKALQQSFREVKGGPPYLVPILEVGSVDQAIRSSEQAFAAGVHGVWLVHRGASDSGETPPHQPCPPGSLVHKSEDDYKTAELEILKQCFLGVREHFPTRWVGLLAPQLDASKVFSWVAQHCNTADGIWLENIQCKPAEISWETLGFGPLAQQRAARLDKWLPAECQKGLVMSKRARQRCGWMGLVVGSVACAPQQPIHHLQNGESMSAACSALLRQWGLLLCSVCDVIATEGLQRSAPSAAKLDALKTARPVAASSCLSISDIHQQPNADMLVVHLGLAGNDQYGANGPEINLLQSWIASFSMPD